MTRPLSADEISAEISRISQRLDFQVGEIAQRARRAAVADVEYRLAHAKAALAVEGATVGEREARALLEVADEFAAHRHADAVLLAAQEAGRSLRAQIDALRTLSAAQRAALVNAEGVGG
ncbi:MAG: hypothetical protein KA249_12080 [Dermatophilaceae bacterium]|nr:hypothetical protein [Dermatophilaceae bacterium]